MHKEFAIMKCHDLKMENFAVCGQKNNPAACEATGFSLFLTCFRSVCPHML